ncbi:hypothetical protein SteCoe_26712 [Stentor coeruleus]|uniref:Haemolysin-III related n=1 Tax=Stentor coeruleus TaxID=5963 RepID=A0A1R2BCM0_9CILI|nr:hypothetical protein SteCoe_26712 [Stentor coeruleus]
MEDMLPSSCSERVDELDEFHKFQQDNEFIIKGYRLYFNTTKKILRSLFLVHNETVNIWTHLVGALMFLMIILSFVFSTDFSSNTLIYKSYIISLESEFTETKNAIAFALNKFMKEISTSSIAKSFEKTCNSTVTTVLNLLTEYESSTTMEMEDVKKWPLFVFLASALICLTMSSCFHLFNAHSARIKVIMNSLDYAGIAILICGSFFPLVYYLFFCNEFYIYLYLIAISVCSTCVFGMTFLSNFQDPHCRWFRGLIFLVLGLSGIFPICHIMFLPHAKEFTDALIYYVFMGVFYVMGVNIYIFRFPERFSSGKFDYIGNSHNIWHCMIVIAAIFHYLAALESYEKRKSLMCN